MKQRTIEQAERLGKLREAGEAIRDGNAVAESGRLSLGPLRRMIDAITFVNSKRAEVEKKRRRGQ